jgi:PKD repeat protein
MIIKFLIVSGYMNSPWLDIIQSVLIKPPIQASGNGSVPTRISLVFRANKTTRYNTDIVESVTYQWSFGDGSQTEPTSEPIISHVFYAPGNYAITLSVVAAYSPSTQVTYRITVYESKAAPMTPPIILL